jgi:hypothetical protein
MIEELKRMWKETVVAQMMYCTGISLEELQITAKNVRKFGVTDKI